MLLQIPVTRTLHEQLPSSGTLRVQSSKTNWALRQKVLTSSNAFPRPSRQDEEDIGGEWTVQQQDWHESFSGDHTGGVSTTSVTSHEQWGSHRDVTLPWRSQESSGKHDSDRAWWFPRPAFSLCWRGEAEKMVGTDAERRWAGWGWQKWRCWGRQTEERSYGASKDLNRKQSRKGVSWHRQTERKDQCREESFCWPPELCQDTLRFSGTSQPSEIWFSSECLTIQVSFDWPKG